MLFKKFKIERNDKLGYDRLDLYIDSYVDKLFNRRFKNKIYDKYKY